MTYLKRRKEGHGRYFYLFQAQNLDLPNLKFGQVLQGHIVESTLGDYEPSKVIVKQAQLEVLDIFFSVPNPFFGRPSQLVNHQQERIPKYIFHSFGSEDLSFSNLRFRRVPRNCNIGECKPGCFCR